MPALSGEERLHTRACTCTRTHHLPNAPPPPQVKVKQLREWAALNERTVQAEVLGQLDSVAADLCELGGAPEGLLEVLAAAAEPGLIELMEARAGAGAPQQSTST